MPKRKSSRVSVNEYKALRLAITTKMERNGFDDEQTSEFARMLDRIGKNDILAFLFLMEKAAPLLPFTEDERMEARQDVKEDDLARRCPKCQRRVYDSETEKQCWRCK